MHLPKFTLKSLLATLLVISLAAVPIVYAATTDTGILSPLGLGADDVVVDDSGNFYLAGFDEISNASSGSAMVETADTADLIRSLGNNNSIYYALADGSGGVYIAGEFTQAQGENRNRVAHFDSNGDITSFDANVGNGIVKSLALSDDGTVLYLGGTFTLVGGVTRTRIAAVDSTTGAVSSWDPTADNQVLAIAEIGSKVYIGGSFTSGGADSNCPTYLCALDVTTGNEASVAGIGADLTVTDFYVDGTDLYVAGGFSNINATSRDGLAEIDTTTDTLTAFNPTNTGRPLAIESDGTDIFAMGSFTTLGGAARNYIGAVNKDTGLATGWAPTTDAGSGDFIDMTISPDGSYLFIATHTLSEVNATSVPERVAKINASTGALEAWDPAAESGDSIAFDYDGSFQSRGLVYIDNDTVLIPGSINYDYETRGGALSVDSSGDFRSWDPEAASGDITDMIVHGSYVYVAGSFDTLGGESISSLGRVDLLTGAVDDTWDPELGTGDIVYDLDTDGTDIFFGGSFSTVDATTRNNIASVSIADASLTSWDPNADNVVIFMQVDDDDAVVYLYGSFDNIGGEVRDQYAGINIADGTATDFDISTNSGSQQISVDEVNNQLYIVTTSTEIAGETYTPGVAKIDIETSTADVAWNPALSYTVDNYAVAYHEGSVIFEENDTSFATLRMIDPEDSSNISSWSFDVSAAGGASILFGGIKVIDDAIVVLQGTGQTLQHVPIPTVTFDSTTGNADEAAETITLNLNMSENVFEDTIYNIEVTGTATEGDDYTLSDTEITIDSGNSTGTFEIDIIDDEDVETDETIIVTITDGIFGFLGDSNLTYTHTINNVDVESSGGGGSSSGSRSTSSTNQTSDTESSETEDETDSEDEEPVSPPAEEESNVNPVEEDTNEQDTNQEQEETTTEADETNEEQETEENEEDEQTVENEEIESQTANSDDSKDSVTTQDQLTNFFASTNQATDNFTSEDIPADIESLDEQEQEELKCELDDHLARLIDDRTSLNEEYKAERARIGASRAAAIQNAKAGFAKELASLKENYQLNVAQFKEEFIAERDVLATEFKTNSANVRSDYKARIQELKASKADAQSIEAVKAERTSALQELKEEFQAGLQKLRENRAEEVAIEKELLLEKSAEVKDEQANTIAEIKADYVEVLADLAETYQALRAELTSRIQSAKASSKQLRGVSCEVEDTEETDNQDDRIEDVIGTDPDDADSDDDDIDDFDEVFLTFTDPEDDTYTRSTTGVVGQLIQTIEGQEYRFLNSNGPVVVSGKAQGNLSCVLESTPNGEATYSCDDKLVVDENGTYLLEFEPENGDGNYQFRIEDEQGVVASYRLDFEEEKGQSLELYSFDGLKEDSFTYIDEDTIMINEKVSPKPVVVVNPDNANVFDRYIVQARWNSLILSSVVLADSNYAKHPLIAPQELTPGKHRALITSVNTDTNMISGTIEVIFEVDDSLSSATETVPMVRWLLMLAIILALLLMLNNMTSDRTERQSA